MGLRETTRSLWWLPGSLVLLLGGFCVIAGCIGGGADRVDGTIIGVMSFLAGGVILWRRAPEQE